MTLDEALSELRRRNEPVPNPPRLPTEDEVNAAERKWGTRFHPDYRQFLLTASDINYGVLEPARITDPSSHTDLFRIAERARGRWNLPEELLPICHDNADYHCMTPDGRMIFWSHDMQGPSGEEWSNLAEWIKQVWMDDYDAR